MTSFDLVEAKLRQGMSEGQMHICLRDIGGLAGGFRAGNAITNHELQMLEKLAVSLSKDKKEAVLKWREAVEFGRTKPIREEVKEYGHFGFEDTVTVTSPKKKAEVPAVEPLVDTNWIEPDDIPMPATDWRPGDMIRYLKAMFEPDECVGIVTTVFESDGKFRPGGKGIHDLTCGFLCEKLSIIGDVDTVVENAIGTPSAMAGVWVRINPLDGKGVKDVNVTAFRHTLIEADDQDLGKQLALIRELELPCSAIVHSGGKSIHALVRVDAPDLETYRARVDRLYQVCEASGLKVDQANRNPSRLSRLPGVARGERSQYLIDLKCGKASWEDWEKHIEESQDDLPDFIQLDSVIYLPPNLNPIYIEGILRKGAKLRLTGPSKAGKSMAAAELCVATAEGHTAGADWFGLKCRQGAVLYINFEQNDEECYERFRSIYKARGWKPQTAAAISIWNLRGKTRPLNKLAPLLIRRAKSQNFEVIVFDPLYKTNWADENNAGEMALFCNELDRISYELGVSVIDTHHHSKGAQGQKKSIDRGSGSGVFGRDPDAILDLIELEITSKRLAELEKRLWQPAVKDLAVLNKIDLDEKIEGSAWNDPSAFFLTFQAAYPEHAEACGVAINAATRRASKLSGWRMEATLRSFETPDPILLWYDYPVHYRDAWDLLIDAKAAGEEAPWVEQQRLKEEGKAAKAAAALEAFKTALEAAGGPDKATVLAVAGEMGVSEDTVIRYVGKAGYGRHRGLILSRKTKANSEADKDEDDEE